MQLLVSCFVWLGIFQSKLILRLALIAGFVAVNAFSFNQSEFQKSVHEVIVGRKLIDSSTDKP